MDVDETFDRDGNLIERVERILSPRERLTREALTDALPLIRAIAQKPRADRTPVERVMLGLAVSIRELRDQVDT